MKKSERVKGYIFWHKETPYGVWNDEIWTPIQANTEENGRIETYGGVADNEGEDNISEWNNFFAEATCMYWIWKNHPKDCDYILQSQYRRRLDVHTEAELDEIFKNHKVLVAAPTSFGCTVFNQYAACHSKEDLFKIKKILYELYPEYKHSWIQYIEGGKFLYYSNGVSMRKEDYDAYCKWLFSLLFELKKEMEWKSPEDVTDFIQRQIACKVRPNRDNKGQPDNAVRYQSQIGGFLSERLLTLYLRHNYKPAEIATVQYTKMETCF